MSTPRLNLSSIDRNASRNGGKRKKVLRVLWPAHCQDMPGWVVGWSLLDCITVATVIEDEEFRGSSDTSPNRADSAGDARGLASESMERLVYSSGEEEEALDDVKEIFKVPSLLARKVELMNLEFARTYWHTELKVLGYFDPHNEHLQSARPYGFGTVKGSDTSRTPRPALFYIDGRSDLVLAQQIVLYDQPQQNEMYSDMFEWKKSTSKSAGSKKQPTPASNTASETYLASLHQINTSRSVEWMLKSESSPLSKELTKEAVTKAFEQVHSHYQPVLWLVARMQVAMLTSVMWLLQLIHWTLNRRIPVLGRLSEYGLMGGFLDKRLVILLNFRDQMARMKTIQYTWPNDPTVQRAWLRFYNSSLSMLVDSLLGFFVAYVLWIFLSPVGFSNATLTKHMTTLWGYEWLNDQIDWIMVGAPAGLKLNTATVQTLGSVFLFYIEQWSVIVRHLAQLTPIVLVLITAVGAFFGLSMLIILVHDIVYFVNMHIYWLYAAITRVYHTQLILLQSLWLLFRGKKRNTLKQRIDSCNASLDQLIVGTLLFTSLIFLLPTTVIYYAFFVYAMCLVLLLQALAQLVVNILNYSPLYSFLLFFWRSRTLTGGIQFQPLDAPVQLATSTSTTSLVMLADQHIAASRQPSSNRGFCTYFRLQFTFVSPTVLLGDLLKPLALVGSNYQLSKLIDCFIFGNTWQNKRFQPHRLRQ